MWSLVSQSPPCSYSPCRMRQPGTPGRQFYGFKVDHWQSEEENTMATGMEGWIHCQLASRGKQLVKIKASGPLNGSEGKGVCHTTNNLSSIPGANGGRETDP